MVCAIANAQNPDIRLQLQRAYELGWDDDMEGAEAILSNISEEDILAEDDSTKYLFYYCKLSTSSPEEPISELISQYIDKAITLRETSIGIYSSEYLELLWVKGDYYELRGDVEQAIRTYEKGIVTGQSLLSSGDMASRYWFGTIMTDLGRLYEQKGYERELIALYNNSFNLLADYYDEDEVSTLVPLTSLGTYYYMQGKYEEALETYNRQLEFITANGGQGTRGHTDCLYFKANQLSKLGRISEAVQLYDEAAGIVKEKMAAADSHYDEEKESLELIYGNWYIMLATSGMGEEAASIEPTLIECLGDDPEAAASAFYGVACFFYEKADYATALVYIEKTAPYLEQLSEEDREVINRCKFLIRQGLDSSGEEKAGKH